MAVVGYVRRTWMRVLLGGGVALLILTPALYFSASKVQLHQLSLASLKQLANSVRAYPRERHLVINPPDWVADIEFSIPWAAWVSPSCLIMFSYTSS